MKRTTTITALGILFLLCAAPVFASNYSLWNPDEQDRLLHHSSKTLLLDNAINSESQVLLAHLETTEENPVSHLFFKCLNETGNEIWTQQLDVPNPRVLQCLALDNGEWFVGWVNANPKNSDAIEGDIYGTWLDANGNTLWEAPILLGCGHFQKWSAWRAEIIGNNKVAITWFDNGNCGSGIAGAAKVQIVSRHADFTFPASGHIVQEGDFWQSLSLYRTSDSGIQLMLYTGNIFHLYSMNEDGTFNPEIHINNNENVHYTGFYPINDGYFYLSKDRYENSSHHFSLDKYSADGSLILSHSTPFAIDQSNFIYASNNELIFVLRNDSASILKTYTIDDNNQVTSISSDLEHFLDNSNFLTIPASDNAFRIVQSSTDPDNEFSTVTTYSLNGNVIDHNSINRTLVAYNYYYYTKRNSLLSLFNTRGIHCYDFTLLNQDLDIIHHFSVNYDNNPMPQDLNTSISNNYVYTSFNTRDHSSARKLSVTDIHTGNSITDIAETDISWFNTNSIDNVYNDKLYIVYQSYAPPEADDFLSLKRYDHEGNIDLNLQLDIDHDDFFLTDAKFNGSLLFIEVMAPDHSYCYYCLDSDGNNLFSTEGLCVDSKLKYMTTHDDNFLFTRPYRDRDTRIWTTLLCSVSPDGELLSEIPLQVSEQEAMTQAVNDEQEILVAYQTGPNTLRWNRYHFDGTTAGNSDEYLTVRNPTFMLNNISITNDKIWIFTIFSSNRLSFKSYTLEGEEVVSDNVQLPHENMTHSGLSVIKDCDEGHYLVWQTTEDVRFTHYDSNGQLMLPETEEQGAIITNVDYPGHYYKEAVVSDNLGGFILTSRYLPYHISHIRLDRISDQTCATYENFKSMPLSFDMAPAYPNPFNAMTSIRVSLPKTAQTTIKLYDVLGREVKTVLSRELSAGDHTFSINATSDSGQPLASGVYFATMEADSFTRTQKIVLLK